MDEREILNQALNAERARLHLRNDIELADAFNIAPKTLSFLRTGRWTKLDRVLIGVLTRFRENECQGGGSQTAA